MLRESLQLESKLVANASENEGNNEDQNFALNESQNLSERAEGYPNSIEYINLDASIEELEQTTSGGRTVAIRNIKEKVQRYIFELKLDSFIGIYNRFVQEEGSLSPALCFLTLLHLSN